MQTADLVHQMKTSAERVLTVVNVVSGLDEACRYTVALTRRQGGETLAAPSLAAPERAVLERHCRDAGLTLLDAPLRPHADRIHTALTHADWGAADTGSLVLDSRPEDLRIATMLAETHVAMLPAQKIRPDLGSLADEIDRSLKADGPVYTAIITGASRTADIERVLAIGVHGPQELHILILEDREG